ncbi:LmbE family N-acetylglucosaminyl deacetylase [Kribbella antiqua]|uniref:LmbE family N-acetylglucosaminyl deacetylase n=1 Tax=Kribbella antiqua TaxID=2512217 RepID=A0A4V2S4R8_9ACTN|nr:PIG-L deacetylase family protein [Kribbella antiqua]TCO49300.1 LmbE family N-acetylglucosaminyl deacetylase [Kribbella antiqua]
MTVPAQRTRPVAEDLGTVLGVWAHPDDEAFLSAGLMAALSDAGHRVVVATATYGELGSPDPVSPEELAATRREEMRVSLEGVGVREHRWLGYRDGFCADATDGEAAVAGLIEEVEPDTILTFGPDGVTGHSDHQAVSAWTTAAWQASGARARLLYATLTPRYYAEWGEVSERLGIWMSDDRPVTADDELAVHVVLTGTQLDRKIAALRAHVSQTTGLLTEVGPEAFRRWWSIEAFVAASPALADCVR